MSAPSADRLWAALRKGWQPAATATAGGFVIREGQGGGSRVSAATPAGDVWDIPAAEAAMHALNQAPLFQITPADSALDTQLAGRGYTVQDDSTVLIAPTALIGAEPPRPVSAFAVWPPLAIQHDLWADGGIGPARLAVMDRAPGPKTALLGRIKDRAAGSGFVVVQDGIACVHALHVLPEFRRLGLARYMMRRAARWAQGQGADWMALIVTRANAPAQALYRGMGMTGATQYHYRRAPAT